MRLATLLLAAALLAATAGTARGDGDPPSDVLPFQDVYFPLQPPSAAARQRLLDAVAASNRANRPIKVAVIASAQDLGSIPSLYGRPQLYARFLGLELPFYPARLLVVMPAGFGVYEHGRSTLAATRALQGLPSANDPEHLVDAATSAVERLRAVPEPGGDLVSPKATALPSKGTAGKKALLRYRLTDNSGRARATIRVYDTGYVLLSTLHAPLGAAKGAVRTSAWHVPADVAGRTLQFCVSAFDAAKNPARPTCAGLHIR
jgi:hypothetical protein